MGISLGIVFSHSDNWVINVFWIFFFLGYLVCVTVLLAIICLVWFLYNDHHLLQSMSIFSLPCMVPYWEPLPSRNMKAYGNLLPHTGLLWVSVWVVLLVLHHKTHLGFTPLRVLLNISSAPGILVHLFGSSLYSFITVVLLVCVLPFKNMHIF